ncbi:MAG TPA: hypothetical protein DEA22_09965, partial [Blastocatellia bacterium]|nr:hypothetical protein [Blastocatellia bacterium]
KENVIMGRLIPAGTGMKYYRNVKVAHDPTENQKPTDEFDELADLRGFDGALPGIPGIDGADFIEDIDNDDEIDESDELEITDEEFDIDQAITLESDDDDL